MVPSHVAVPTSRPAVSAAKPPRVSPAVRRLDSARPIVGRRGSVGLATYYADRFSGRPTASGVPFDSQAMVAAHPTYSFGTVVRVTNLRNGRSVQVRIVDRGPARRARQHGVIIDLSPAAAASLRIIRPGRAPVRLAVVSSP